MKRNPEKKACVCDGEKEDENVSQRRYIIDVIKERPAVETGEQGQSSQPNALSHQHPRGQPVARHSQVEVAQSPRELPQGIQEAQTEAQLAQFYREREHRITNKRGAGAGRGLAGGVPAQGVGAQAGPQREAGDDPAVGSHPGQGRHYQESSCINLVPQED